MAKYLIVGAGSAVGKSLATILLPHHQVIAIGRNESPIQHPNYQFYQVDILEDAPQFPMIEELDGLVYCPGSITLKPFHRLGLTDFEHEWRLNFLGAVKALQHYYPTLKKSAQASVVLFSTVAVKKGMPFHGSISAAKGAVEALGKSLAAEWAPTIRVNTIAPSLTDTPLASALLNTEAKQQAGAERHPLKRIGQPEDLAQTAAWLLGSQSSWITGQVIAVDGGMSM